jgi:protein ImuB
VFEPVAAAVEQHAVGVEVVRPGIVAVPVGGAAGYFGGEEALAERLLDEVSANAGVECQVGIADGLFAATLAARRATLVAPGSSAEFLAPLPVAELDQPGEERGELVGLLGRLGLRTLGAFAAAAERDVAGRFGRDAILAHRLARGLSQRPPLRRTLPPELEVVEEFETPLERIDEAAFIAKTLDRFFSGLARHGMACTRLAIVAVTESGEERVRVWRCAEPLTARATADRVRWQCEGWLTAAPGTGRTPASFGCAWCRRSWSGVRRCSCSWARWAATPTPSSGPAGRWCGSRDFSAPKPCSRRCWTVAAPQPTAHGSFPGAIRGPP